MGDVSDRIGRPTDNGQVRGQLVCTVQESLQEFRFKLSFVLSLCGVITWISTYFCSLYLRSAYFCVLSDFKSSCIHVRHESVALSAMSCDNDQLGRWKVEESFFNFHQ